MTKYERWLLQLVIFLVPTNLAYHWYGEWAYINGRLVDYLLPKLYVSDLAIILLFSLFLFRSYHSGACSRIFDSFSSGRHTRAVLVPLLWLGYLLIQATFSDRPLPSLWMGLKVAEIAWLTWYIVHHYQLPAFLNTLYPPLWLAAVVQSIIGLAQFIMQKSIFGYYLFGESNLDRLGVATESYLGQLLVAPYGTTPHPNVLAGFLAFSLLILLLRQNVSVWKGNFTLFFSSMGLFGLILGLSVSLETLLALFVCAAFIFLSVRFITRRLGLLFLVMLFSGILLSPLFVGLLYHSSLSADNASIVTRYELNLAAFKLLKQSPLTGVGLNGFIPAMVSSGLLAGQQTFVYQPVHHIFLLGAVEIGIIGLILTGLSIYMFNIHHPLPRLRQPYTAAPLLCLLTIGGFDHYPLTLQTGQLLLALSLSLLWVRESRQTKNY